MMIEALDDAIDKFLAFGSCFDWITPAMSFVYDVTRFPSHTFILQREGMGYSGNDVRDLLRQHGIETWGHMIVRGDIMITVRKRQAAWSQYLLDTNGMLIKSGVFSDRRYPLRQPGTALVPLAVPAAIVRRDEIKARQPDMMDRIIGLVDGVLG